MIGDVLDPRREHFVLDEAVDVHGVGGAVVWLVQGQHLQQGHPEAIDVGVHAHIVADDLRRQPLRSPEVGAPAELQRVRHEGIARYF